MVVEELEVVAEEEVAWLIGSNKSITIFVPLNVFCVKKFAIRSNGAA
jgi:hypothetical protein